MSTPDSPLDPVLDELWEGRADLTPENEDARKIVIDAVDALDAGTAKVATVGADGEGHVDERAKRAILLSFKVLPMTDTSAGDFQYHDRVPLKTRFHGVHRAPGATPP